MGNAFSEVCKSCDLTDITRDSHDGNDFPVIVDGDIDPFMCARIGVVGVNLNGLSGACHLFSDFMKGANARGIA